MLNTEFTITGRAGSLKELTGTKALSPAMGSPQSHPNHWAARWQEEEGDALPLCLRQLFGSHRAVSIRVLHSKNARAQVLRGESQCAGVCGFSGSLRGDVNDLPDLRTTILELHSSSLLCLCLRLTEKTRWAQNSQL